MSIGLTVVGLNSLSVFNQSRTQKALSRAFAQVASGYRISSAADDAAGLAVASGLTASITTISQASRNVSDTVSALTIADGALGQVSEISTRMRELATMAANGTLSDEQRGALQMEYAALSEEIQRIGATTSYNDKSLLDGSSITAQIGPAGETLTVNGVNLQSLSSGVTSQDISTQAGGQAAMSAIDQFAQDLTTQRTGTIGSAMSRLESIQNNLSNQSITYNSALSQIRDADLSSAVVDLTRAKVLQQYQVALFQQASILQASTRLSILG
jgi:flagellin